MRGCVFELEIDSIQGMAKLIDMVKFQNWEYPFEPLVPTLHEKKERIFYQNLTFSNDAYLHNNSGLRCEHFS